MELEPHLVFFQNTFKGDETPTSPVTGVSQSQNQSSVLQADAVDNATHINKSPPLNGAVIDYYEAVVWPRDHGPEGEGGRVHWMFPIRFTHFNLPCDGWTGSSAFPLHSTHRYFLHATA